LHFSHALSKGRLDFDGAEPLRTEAPVERFIFTVSRLALLVHLTPQQGMFLSKRFFAFNPGTQPAFLDDLPAA
jgi:hypothetical protein